MDCKCERNGQKFECQDHVDGRHMIINGRDSMGIEKVKECALKTKLAFLAKLAQLKPQDQWNLQA